MEYLDFDLSNIKNKIDFSLISREEILMYLGCKSDFLEYDIKATLENEIKSIKDVVRPRFCYDFFEIITEGEKIIIDNHGREIILEGNSIKKLLKDSFGVVIFSETLGVEVDTYLRRLQIFNMYRAVVADAVASTMIEHFCNEINKELEFYIRDKGVFLTERYSAGYGDFSLEVQSHLLRLIECSKKIGVTLNESLIIILRKSISEIIGIGKRAAMRAEHICDKCRLSQNCRLKNRGVQCNKYEG